MLLERLFECGDQDMLYHYCSAATFQAVATFGTIRFTDINMLNDASEMRHAYSVFEEAVTRLINKTGLKADAPTIPIEFFDKVDSIIAPAQLVAHPFISCFSLQSDMLGQWRSYADDGRGYAIGFRANALKNALPATFLRVLYDREEQVQEMMLALAAIFLRQDSDDSTVSDKFFEDCILLSVYMTAFKHSAFAEEKEVRAVHAISVQPEGNLLKFIDEGGTVNGDSEAIKNPINFQIRDNHLTAYFDHQFCSPTPTTPMCEVILGPKNYSAPGNLALFLGGLGYTGMEFKMSEAPYR